LLAAPVRASDSPSQQQQQVQPLTAVRSPFAVAVDILFPEPDPDRERIEEDYETWLQVMFGGYAKYPLVLRRGAP
jgi:hypothetical protein